MEGWKRTNTKEVRRNYRKLNNRLRRITDKARETWIAKRCEEIDVLMNAGRSDLSYKVV